MILRKNKMREMSDQDLNSKIDELKLELSKERSKIKIGGFPENPGKIREMRKTIARMNTVLHMNITKQTSGGKK